MTQIIALKQLQSKPQTYKGFHRFFQLTATCSCCVSRYSFSHNIIFFNRIPVTSVSIEITNDERAWRSMITHVVKKYTKIITEITKLVVDLAWGSIIGVICFYQWIYCLVNFVLITWCVRESGNVLSKHTLYKSFCCNVCMPVLTVVL